MDAFGVENVGGYRLVRKLGDGERAEVWLGHSSHPASGSAGRAVVAVKLYRAGVTVRSIDVEIEALTRASSPHLVELLDIASGTDGRPCLILRRPPNGSLEQLFTRRHTFSAGQLVTALAPVTAAIAELHRLGIAHGGIAARAVLLDARHAPVLACFGASQVIGEPPADGSLHSLTIAQVSVNEAIAADLGNVATLVRSFAGRVDSPHSCSALLEWLKAGPCAEDTLAELADRLYELADAAPLDSSEWERERPSLSLPPQRAQVSSTSSCSELVPGASNPPQAEAGVVWIGIARVIGSLRQLGSDEQHGAILDRLKALARTVRRPVWLAAGFGCAAIVLAIGVIPSLASSRSSAVTPGPTGTAAPSSRFATSVDAAIISDDPAAAALALIAARARCLADRSSGCLATVEQPGSAALEADRYFLAQLQAGSTVKDRNLDASVATVIERLGDSAIIGLGEPTSATQFPASVLIVKDGKAWRIRDLTSGVTP